MARRKKSLGTPEGETVSRHDACPVGPVEPARVALLASAALFSCHRSLFVPHPDDSRAPAAPHDPDHPGSGPMHVKRTPVAPGSMPTPQEGDELKLPHERDQSVSDSTSAIGDADPRMLQAKKDLDAGQMDTDMRNVPGVDADRRRDAVGGEAGASTPPSDPV